MAVAVVENAPKGAKTIPPATLPPRLEGAASRGLYGLEDFKPWIADQKAFVKLSSDLGPYFPDVLRNYLSQMSALAAIADSADGNSREFLVLRLPNKKDDNSLRSGGSLLLFVRPTGSTETFQNVRWLFLESEQGGSRNFKRAFTLDVNDSGSEKLIVLRREGKADDGWKVYLQKKLTENYSPSRPLTIELNADKVTTLARGIGPDIDLKAISLENSANINVYDNKSSMNPYIGILGSGVGSEFFSALAQEKHFVSLQRSVSNSPTMSPLTRFKLGVPKGLGILVPAIAVADVALDFYNGNKNLKRSAVLLALDTAAVASAVVVGLVSGYLGKALLGMVAAKIGAPVAVPIALGFAVGVGFSFLFDSLFDVTGHKERFLDKHFPQNDDSFMWFRPGFTRRAGYEGYVRAVKKSAEGE